MNRVYLTAAPGTSYAERDVALADWHGGKPFKIYQHGLCSRADTMRLILSGFTHACFVWQDRDLVAQHHDLELKP